MSAHTSHLFPRVLKDVDAQVTEHHDVLARHGRVLGSHTTQLVALTERMAKVESSDHHVALEDFERRIDGRVRDLELNVTRLRTAIYVAAVMIGGSVAGGSVVDRVSPAPAAVVTLAPEILEALRAPAPATSR